MDFRVVDSLVCSNSATAAPNNGGSLASETDADVNKLRLYGSAFLIKETTAAEDDLPAAKVARLSSCGSDLAKVPLQQCDNGGVLSQPHQQMLSFSAHNAPPLAFPFVRSSSGYGCGGVNATSMHGVLSGVRGPFTSSQWMELEQQALIFKYITANVPIPSYLLIPIRKALESSGFSCFSLLRPNALGWGGFHLGFSKTDPEPGRCRRTDGKKWRCSRDAVADQKYCERHMNRGRHRSRKPVEGQPGLHSATTTNGKPTPTSSVVPAGGASKSFSLLHHHQQTNNQTSGKTSIDRCRVDKETATREYQHTAVVATAAPKMCFKDNQQNAYMEFGSVCSDSLLNPLNRSSSLVTSRSHGNHEDESKSEHALRQFIDEWPKSLRSSTASPTNKKLSAYPLSLSREFEATQMGLSVGSIASEQSQRQRNSWVPISWEPSVGGPLGEALHTTSNSAGECKNNKALNLMEPLGVLRGAFNSIAVSSPGAESSKALDGATFCNGLIGTGLMLPSLPAL
ncbi:hypothetical protein C2S53_002222 [Perilla frutescens var. hirtella]|uniref:Growth-regulating factor n=1 Tax=Perilla frutescens var. hirtella TaxID=608512 RepID=A0AAD4IS69_PERFH|nr:hypothetical protein C2S53_002222 [Perilla frutescens var. hirtella]